MGDGSGPGARPGSAPSTEAGRGTLPGPSATTTARPPSTEIGAQGALPGLTPPAKARAAGARSRAEPALAGERPIARVALELQPAHLDRVFDYLVPAAMDADAQPGVRIRARFGGQDVGGYLLARVAASEHPGRLLPLRRVVSAEPVLTPEVARLARAVADRYAGTLADVLRLAIPPRHARVEAAGTAAPAVEPGTEPGTEPRIGPDSASVPGFGDRSGPTPGAAWADYRGGAAFLSHLAAGHAPRAVWTALPGAAGAAGPHWAAAIAGTAAVAVRSGRGALVVVPDARDVARVCAALAAAGLPEPDRSNTAAPVVRLTADQGPAARYRAFLAALRGSARVVVGTRAAAFAPVRDLGLIVTWDDGEETLTEPRAPYPQALDVLAIRAGLETCAMLIGSLGRTVEAQARLESGWARELAAPRAVLRARGPRVRALTSAELANEGPGAAARIPSAAWRAAKAALAAGPVLVQVPRAGYLPVVACARCREPARCSVCHGPLAVPAAGAGPQCTWCGALPGGWSCPACGGTALRSIRVGSARTAEELGRAFPGVPVRVSAASAPGGVLSEVPAGPALVVATPGAEPAAPGGYAAALLLDAAASTTPVGLDVATRALHRWLAAASLVRPAAAGGQVLLVGDAAPAPTGALVRWDPGGLAAREFADRLELGLPPAVRVAAVTGDRAAVAAVVGRIELATPQAVLGPTEVHTAEPTLDPKVRVAIRVPAAAGAALAAQVAASMAVRSARREGGTVRAQLDPRELV